MARPKYKIESRQDGWYAYEWLRHKFSVPSCYFPYGDDQANAIRKNINAEDEFKEADTPEELNTWCEAHLNSAQWRQLKNGIRAGRMRNNRKRKPEKSVCRIDISHQARYMLQELSKRYGVTYSEIIEKYLKNDFMNLN